MASSRRLCSRKAWHANQPSERSSQPANTLAKFLCSRWSVEGFAEIHKTAVELSPFTAVLVLQSMEDIVLITGALGRSCILEQVCRQAIMARCLTALGPPQGSFNLCGSDVSVQLCRIRGRIPVSW
eukprot:jgi/Astpho2/1513/Aster-05393